MEQVIHFGNILNAILYAFIGIAVFGVGFVLVDRLTPYQLWKEIIEEKNIALAIIVGSISIGICLIVASAIH